MGVPCETGSPAATSRETTVPGAGATTSNGPVVCSSSGASDFTWLFYAAVFPTDDPEEALPHLWHQRWKYADMDASASRQGPVPAAPEADDEMIAKLHKTTVIGSPQRIVDYFGVIQASVDVPVRFMARSHFATLEFARQVELLDQLAEEVLPHT